MADARRLGRSGDDRDVAARTARGRAGHDEARAARGGASEADRLGREQQRRATAYGRARGQL